MHRTLAASVVLGVVVVIALGGCNPLSGRSHRRRAAASSHASAPAARAATDGQPASHGPAKGSAGLSRRVLTVAGLRREVAFYAPRSRSGSPPLVIAFHGTSGQAEDWVDGHDASGIESLADEHGFVVAAPASRFISEPDWDHEYEGGDRYWETAGARGSDPKANPDLLLVSALIDAAQADYGVDPKRAYALGFSNGGFFALLTAMALRDRIAAFAEAGSGLVTCSTTRACKVQSSSTDCAVLLREAAACGCAGAEKPIALWTSGRLVPGFVAHNNRDDVVSPAYTCALHERMKRLGYEVELLLGDGEGHGVPEGFLPRAWSFLSARRLP